MKTDDNFKPDHTAEERKNLAVEDAQPLFSSTLKIKPIESFSKVKQLIHFNTKLPEYYEHSNKPNLLPRACQWFH